VDFPIRRSGLPGELAAITAVISVGYWAEVDKNSIVSTLNASLFSFSEPDNFVVFQYGTPLTDSNFVGTPSRTLELDLVWRRRSRNCGIDSPIDVTNHQRCRAGDSGLLAFLRLRDAVE